MPKLEPTSAEYQQLLDENDTLRSRNVRLRGELKHKDQINQAAFCCTMNGNKPEKALATMEELSGKTPIAIAAFRAENIEDDSYISDLEAFVGKLA